MEGSVDEENINFPISRFIYISITFLCFLNYIFLLRIIHCTSCLVLSDFIRFIDLNSTIKGKLTFKTKMQTLKIL